jgi:hypothetical protein
VTTAKRLATATAAAVLLCSASAFADDGVTWRFTTGFEYSTGRYQEPIATNVVLVPLTAKAYWGDWTFRVSSNLLNIHGPANVTVIDDGTGGAGGVGGVIPTGSTVPPANRNGFGDSTIAADYTFSRMFATPLYADLSARLRLPTGNAGQGLGSGAVDEIVNAEIGGDWDWGGGYVSAGRRFLGDHKAFVRHDGNQFGAGGWVLFGKYYELGTYYEYRDAVTNTLPDAQDIGAYLSYRLASDWKLQLDASHGLSGGAATADVGLYITYRPDGGYR